MNIKRTLMAAIAASAMSLAARADSITYVLKDIGTFQGYQATNVGQTYSGNGFVGLYEWGDFGHLFGVEQSNFSRTAIQADVSGLAGASVTSAFLSFDILDGESGPQNVTVSSYLGDGALGHDWNPAAEASGNYSVAHGSNSIDVTALVSGIISAGNPWLGLHLMGSSQYLWTYTYSGYGYDDDRAKVRLTINYGASGVPDHGATLGLIAIAFGSLALLRRRMR